MPKIKLSQQYIVRLLHEVLHREHIRVNETWRIQLGCPQCGVWNVLWKPSSGLPCFPASRVPLPGWSAIKTPGWLAKPKISYSVKFQTNQYISYACYYHVCGHVWTSTYTVGSESNFMESILSLSPFIWVLGFKLRLSGHCSNLFNHDAKHTINKSIL